LAKNPKLQRKVQSEIDGVLNIDYESIMQMRFLDCCIQETLRKYPPAPFLMRECEIDYEIHETSQTIPKGTQVYISVFGIHRDPEYFESPLEFKPERFFRASKCESLDKGMIYFPFGDGPRICVGKRMGLLTVKLGIFMILKKFNFEFPNNQVPEIKFSAEEFVLTIKNEINLKITTREEIEKVDLNHNLPMKLHS
jgi:cytochrome P450 family 6